MKHFYFKTYFKVKNRGWLNVVNMYTASGGR